jgi:hypothetical protein
MHHYFPCLLEEESEGEKGEESKKEMSSPPTRDFALSLIDTRAGVEHVIRPPHQPASQRVPAQH